MTTISHPAGRFVAQPIQRGNLTGDLRGFLAEALGYEEQSAVSGEDSDALTHLAQALIINVLDAHLDASYWQGRAHGYANHHGEAEAVSVDADSIETNNTEGAHE